MHLAWSRRTMILAVAVLCGLAVGSRYLYRQRTHVHLYHLLLLKIRGDVAAKRTMALYQIRFLPEKYIPFDVDGPAGSLRPTWAFRPSHAAPTYPVPVVDDTDQDGIPEVYLGSYTRQLYVLNGRDGSLLWDWPLPFGVIGGVAVALADLNRDGRNEVVFGTHWSLPIRVYALRTEPDVDAAHRLLWARNIAGDFLECGFNVARLDGRTYIVAATRDAPYSRGSLNVIKGDGTFAYRPISGLDVCANRIGVGWLPGSGRCSIVHGSHNFYGARFGHHLTARDLATGRLLWNVPLAGDTGYQLHQLLDLDFDGDTEVIGAAGTNGIDRFYALDGATGAVVKQLPGFVFGIMQREQLVLMQGPDGISCFDRQGQRLYTLPAASFGVRFAEDGAFHLIHLAYAKGILSCDVYNGATGAHERRYETPMTLPPYEDAAAYGYFGPPGTDGALFRTLADTDRDGYWDALVLCGYTIVNVHLPLRVAPGYDPNALVAYRNTTNEGALYEPTLSRPQAGMSRER